MKHFIFWGLLLCSLKMTGQKLPEKVQFQSLPINEFANYSVVNDFLQDPHGLMWVACNGLLRFDGRQFTDITDHQSGIPLNLRGREINKLFWDGTHDRLLITTRNNGLLSYSYEDDKIRMINKETEAGILRDMIRRNDSVIWITSQEKGIFKLENNTLERDRKLSQIISSPSAALVHKGQIIIGEVNKVFFVKNDLVTDTLMLKEISRELSVNTRVTSMLVDKMENLWIGTEKNGVIVYSLTEKKTIKIFSPSNTPLFNRIEKIIQDQRGLIWIITKANGLVIYSPEHDSYKHIRQLFFRSGANPVGTCNAIMEDNTGVIWVGSIGEVRKYDPTQLPFEHFLHNPEDSETLSDNMIRGMSEDEHDNIWIGTEGGFLNRFDRSTSKIERIRVMISGETEHLTAYSVVETSPNYFLVTTNRGVVEFNYRTKKFNYYEPLKKISQGVPNRHMMLHRDTLWIVSYARLVMHVVKTRETKVYRDFQFPKHVRQSNNITCIGLDHLGRKWIGTNSGISRFDPKREQFFYHSLRDDLQKDSLSTMVLSIQGIKDQLWVGTFQRGLYVFDLSKGNPSKPLYLSQQDGLPDNTIYGCLEDDNGLIWMSTNLGLASYDPKKKSFLRYSTVDGLQENEYNRLTYLKSVKR
jgi:Predicted periplasmic ligand-binding sensor domain